MSFRIRCVGASGQLDIDVRHDGAGRVIIALTGELDMASAPLLQRAIADSALAASAVLVLDLEQLSFLDSTGLRIILGVRELCQERGQGFAVTPGSPQVQRLLSITGVAEHLQMVAAPE